MHVSWITSVWSGAAAACVTMALVHLAIWLKQPRRTVHLVFAILAVSVAVIAACELMLMYTQTPEQFGKLLRWTHVPVFFAVISVALFVRLYFNAGSWWLAGAACGLRAVALILNFYFEPNLNYLSITGLDQLEMPGGETVSVAAGISQSMGACWAGKFIVTSAVRHSGHSLTVASRRLHRTSSRCGRRRQRHYIRADRRLKFRVDACRLNSNPVFDQHAVFWRSWWQWHTN